MVCHIYVYIIYSVQTVHQYVSIMFNKVYSNINYKMYKITLYDTFNVCLNCDLPSGLHK